MKKQSSKKPLRKVRERIVLLGEGKTEWFYFDYLKKTLSFDLNPSLPRPKNSDYKKILLEARRLLREGFDKVICIFDYDKVREDHREEEFSRDMNGLDERISVLLSMPCIEFWFFLHSWPSLQTKLYETYDQIVAALKKIFPDYEKTCKYYRGPFFSRLEANGGRERAVEYARKLDTLREQKETDISFSEIYRIFDILQ